ncbi:TMV resistance protein N-like [Nymphaea colorata]|nr:TMV resistance protein N-like [Nymphaea colorata]
MHRRSIANLSKLEELNLQGCRRLQSLPPLPSSLKTLILQGCKLLKAVHGFQHLESMELLDMDGCEKINFTLMSSLFKGKTFRHLEELSASASKTLTEDENFSFIVPLDSPSNPLLLQQLHCYGDGSKSGSLPNIYIKVCVKDMEDNLVIYETIFSGYRDVDNDISGQCSWCYTVSSSEYDDINICPELYRPCSICVSTVDNFPLIRVDILLRSARRWTRNYSEVIPVGENITNSRRISAEQNQPLPSMLSAEYFTFEFDVLFRYVEEDIPTKFINNLYKALQQHGICIFKGEDAESKGEEYLLNCIERSAICIPIFSKRFPQSKWHLKSVAKMVEFRKFIIPVYFQVRPLDIRDQKEEFGTYFSRHKNEDRREIVEDWRKALEVVVRRCHHQFIYKTSRYMEELITVICNRISSMLNSVTFRITPPSFGVKDVIRMLEKDGDNVCMVGICGQSGMGKTTIAKAIYDQLSHDFVDSAFIPYVRAFEERKWQFLGQRVLIVFDDVDGLDNFQSRETIDRDLFGKGSKIIVLAKDQKDLISFGGKEDNIYFAHELNNMQSLRFLSYYAFKGKQPTAEIVELARKVTEFVGGLPLGLAVLGSLLSSMRTKEEWKSMLEKLSSAPNEGIDKVLKVSMDALHPNQLQIFFDIICRLIGCEKEYATYVWEDCGYSPTDAIKVLQQRALISIDEIGRFRMNDEIRDMCRSMVESGELKFWIENGLLVAFPDWEVFKKLKVLEIICCSDVYMASQDFSLMPNLVKLVIDFPWTFDQIPMSVWRFGKLEYLRITGAMEKLSSSISNLSSLQTLDLGGSYQLYELPKDLGDLAALRKLILCDCALFEIPSSVVQLNHLRTLNVSGCWSLLCLPQLPSSLIILDASECTDLRQVADISSLKDLRTLNLDRCDELEGVPGLQNLKSLTFLKLPFHISQSENL